MLNKRAKPMSQRSKKALKSAISIRLTEAVIAINQSMRDLEDREDRIDAIDGLDVATRRIQQAREMIASTLPEVMRSHLRGGA